MPTGVRERGMDTWDAVVVGGGHNGLTAAAYLARAGRSVLVLERRDRLGGACTQERPFRDPAFVTSPCAYLVGLLHPLVIEELDLVRRGFRMLPCDPVQWTPFDDGSSLTQWRDPARTAEEVRSLAPRDVDGFLAYEALFDRIRERLRGGPRGRRDTWLGDAPDPDELEELLAGDPEARDVVLHASIADVVEGHVRDPRLRAALHGQGIIGTFAGPRDPGTAWIHAHHRLGLLGGWGYVEGGMGRISECLAAAARDAGAVVRTDAEVVSITPGEGVRLADGEEIRSRAVVANTDPMRTLALVEGDVPDPFRDRVRRWACVSPVVKVNCALARLPSFVARSGQPPVPHRAQIEITASIDDTQAAYERARAGEPAPVWAELYFHTAYDGSVAPPGAHTMSVFAQYAPYSVTGGWGSRREEIGDAVLSSIARFAPDVDACIVEREVLGPPDVEARVGLSGGHIFQGECLPNQMWSRRFASRTPLAGLYLCGAATHPGGSVMAVNGRNAAMALLEDLSAAD